jgi:hypothetical protein
LPVRGPRPLWPRATRPRLPTQKRRHRRHQFQRRGELPSRQPRAEIQVAGYVFPYLYDETQAIAQAYRAACTPDIFLFDKAQKLVYRGQFDDSRPGNGKPVTGRDLRAALDAVLADKPVPANQQPSIGCNIKWKSGNEPDYF